jgi:hypothetical protein
MTTVVPASILVYMDLSQRTLLDDFKVSGHWWLPGKPEDKVAGVLSVSPQAGVRLELVGLFSHLELDSMEWLTSLKLPRLDIVLGADSDGEAHTLHTVDLVNTSTNSFRVSFLLAGRHFPSVEEISFSSALVELSNLEAWSCYQFWRSPKSDSLDSFRIELPNTGATLFRTKAAGPVRELSLNAYTASRFTRRALEVRPHAHFKVDLCNSTDLKAFFSVLADLGQFTTMLVGEPTYVKKLRFFGSAEPVDAFFSSDVEKGTEIDSPLMCFPLADVSNIVQTLAENWFGSTPLLSPVYDLLFGTLFNRASFVKTKFINLSQALESFHRRELGGMYISPEAYLDVQGALNAAIPANVTGSLRQKISDSIKYANEYSFRKRLKELLSGLRGSTLDVLKISDVAGTAEVIVKTRNYLTHFDEESRTGLADDIVGVHYMNERLTALLFILILKKLGMNEEFAARGVVRRRFFQ